MVMQLATHAWRSRTARACLALIGLLATLLEARTLVRRNAHSERPTVMSSEPSKPASPARLAEIDSSFRAIEDGERDTPRDTWDPDYIVSAIGHDPQELFAWVRDNTYWIPYRGILRGPSGVLMDRQGNSLDRALLLATLLERAGHTVRLAHGDLGGARARDLLPSLMMAHAAASSLANIEPRASSRVEFAAAQYHLDGAATAQRRHAHEVALDRVVSTLDARVADQTARLLKSVPHADGRAEWSKRYEGALAALADHWWVQQRVGDRWADLDVQAMRNSPLVPLADITDTLSLGDVAGASLHQEIVVRVIGEQWLRGALTEHKVLEYVLRPADLIGRSIVLRFWPMEWIADTSKTPGPNVDLRSAVIEQHAWVASLLIDRDAAATSALVDEGDDVDKQPAGGPMGGLGSALSKGLASQGDAASATTKELSAVWLEYEVRIPGEKPRIERRTVFDLIGPAARATTQKPALSMDDSKRFSRGLSLMMKTELLPISSQLSPEFVRHLAAEDLLGGRDLMRAAARGALAHPSAVVDTLIDRARPAVSPLYTLAFARMAASRNTSSMYIDSPGLLTRHVYARISGSSVAVQDATDIVANAMGVSLTEPDAIPIRVAQGVLDTNAESLFRLSADVVGNSGDAFAASRDWTTLASKDSAILGAMTLSDDARRRINAELAAGFVVIAPRDPVPMRPTPFVGWWRVNPKTGQVLGFDEKGWGDAGDAVIIARRQLESYTFRKAMARFAFGFSEAYTFCFMFNYIDETSHSAAPIAAAVTKSPKNCAAQSFAFGTVSAVAPLVFLTLRYRYAIRYGSAGPYYKLLNKLRKVCKTEGGGGGEGGGGTNTADPLGKTQPDPTRTQRIPDQKADPLGRTNPDPTKTQKIPDTKTIRDPECCPTEPPAEPPSTAPANLREAARKVGEAKAKLDAAIEKSSADITEYVKYQENKPGPNWPGDPSKWDATLNDALRERANASYWAKRAAEDVYLDAQKALQEINDLGSANTLPACGSGGGSAEDAAAGISGLGADGS